MDQLSNRLSFSSQIWSTTTMYLTILALIPVLLFKRWLGSPSDSTEPTANDHATRKKTESSFSGRTKTKNGLPVPGRDIEIENVGISS
ncbi:hypothetical protein VKT23_018844 [Stygiomarasmius scandens]|uniref:ATP synthase F0 subunit 8 n=1 Tax=Marasmiellus scandens TaxID=2682957 RepID=A0ABR1IQG0_9AGAR